MLTLDNVIFGVLFGLIIGSVLSFLNYSIIGDCVRKLLAARSFSPEGGKTLNEMQCKPEWLLRFSLRRGSSLRNIVSESPAAKGVYYIEERNVDRAERGYAKNKITVLNLVIVLVALIAFMIMLSYLLPDIVNLFTKMISTLTENETA